MKGEISNMSEVTGSANADNSKKSEDLENIIDNKRLGVCCMGFQKGPEMVLLPTEPMEPDYVFQEIIDELRKKYPNESEVTISLVVPELREEYEAVKAKLKAKQAAQEKALFGDKEDTKQRDDGQEK